MNNIRQIRFANHQIELNSLSSAINHSAVKTKGSAHQERIAEFTFNVPKKNGWLISSVENPEFWKKDVSMERLLSSVYQEVSQKAARIAVSLTQSINGDPES